MSDTQEVIREFRFLDDKRKTTGLSSDEEVRWQALAGHLGIQAEAPVPQGYWGTDGQWYAYPPGYDPNLAYQQGYTPEGYPTGYYYDSQTGQPYADPNQMPEGGWPQQAGQWPQSQDPNAGYAQDYGAPEQQAWPQQTEPAPAMEPVAPAAEAHEDGPIEVDADDVMEVSDDDVQLLDPSPPVSAPVGQPEPAPTPWNPEQSLTGSLDDIGIKPEKRLTREIVAASALLPMPEPKPSVEADSGSFLPELSAPEPDTSSPHSELLADVLPADPSVPFAQRLSLANASTPAPVFVPEPESGPVVPAPIAERAPIQLFATAPQQAPAPNAPEPEAAPIVVAPEPVPEPEPVPTAAAPEPIPEPDPAPLVTSALEPIPEPEPAPLVLASELISELRAPTELLPELSAAPSETTSALLPELAPVPDEAAAQPLPPPEDLSTAAAATEEKPAFPVHHTPTHLLPRPEPVRSTEDPITFLLRALTGDKGEQPSAEPVTTETELPPAAATTEPEAPPPPPQPPPAPLVPEVQAAPEPPHEDMPIVEAITVVEAPVPQSASLLAAALLGDDEPAAPEPTVATPPFGSAGAPAFPSKRTPTAFPKTKTPSAFPTTRTPYFGTQIPTEIASTVPTPPRGTAIPKAALPSLSIKASATPAPVLSPIPTAAVAAPTEWDEPTRPVQLDDAPLLDLVEATPAEPEPPPLEGVVLEEAPLDLVDAPLDLVETAPALPEWEPAEPPPDPAPTARFGRPVADWSADVLSEAPPPPPPPSGPDLGAYDLSGIAGDKVELAQSAAEFLSYPAAPSADVGSSFSEEGNDLIDVSPLAAMANPTEYGYDRSDSMSDDGGELELATNADFVSNPALTSTGEKWNTGNKPAAKKWQTDVDDLLPPEKQAPRASPSAGKSSRDFSKPAPARSSPPLPVTRHLPALSKKITAPPEEEVLTGLVVEDEEEAPTEFEMEEHEALPSAPSPSRSSTPGAPRASAPMVPRPSPAQAARLIPGAPPPRPSAPLAGPRAGNDPFDRRGISFHEDTGLKMVVAGEHKVILHTLEGQVKRGLLRNPDLVGKTLTLETTPNSPAEEIARPRLKVVFFVQPPGVKPEPITGTKVRVTFRDGRQVAGFSSDFKSSAPGFFVVPAENRANTARIFIYREAITSVNPD